METTAKGCFVKPPMTCRTLAAVPTGTVDLLTTTLKPFMARPMPRPRPARACRSADPSSSCGVPTAMKRMSLGLDRRVEVGREAQALLGDVARHHLVQARLVDRDLAAEERVHLGLVVVDADDAVAVLGEAGAHDQTDVTGPHDAIFIFSLQSPLPAPGMRDL